MVHFNYKDSKNIIEAFSEDWAEIRSAVNSHYKITLRDEHKEREKELDSILDRIYTGLYLNSSPVILIDKDEKHHQEYKNATGFNVQGEVKKDDYGHPICCNDIRRRSDLPNATKHELWRLSGITLASHSEREKEILLCINCRQWVNEKGDFLQTI